MRSFRRSCPPFLRSLPLRRPPHFRLKACATWCAFRKGITAKVFATLNEFGIEAVRTCSERITDEAIEARKPAVERRRHSLEYFMRDWNASPISHETPKTLRQPTASTSGRGSRP